MIDVQVLTPDDWPLWRELRLRALAEAPYAFGSKLADWQGEGDREERWRDRLSGQDSHNVVARLDREPVGMASGVPAHEGDVALISMWVAPDGRGRGVADALVADIESWARRRGADRFLLDVVVDNERARSFYRRCGFVDVGPLPRETEEAALELRMEKLLSP